MTSRGVKCSPAVSFESFRELADQLLEDQRPSARCGTDVGMQVDVGELLGDQVEQVRLRPAGRSARRTRSARRCRARRREAPACRRRGSGAMWSWSPISFCQVERARCCRSCWPALRSRNGSGFTPGLLALGQLRQHGGLGRLQHAVEPAQHGERQDDLAVLGLLVVAAQQVGDGPDEVGELGEVLGHGPLGGFLLRSRLRSSREFRGDAELLRVVAHGNLEEVGQRPVFSRGALLPKVPQLGCYPERGRGRLGEGSGG